MSEIAFSTETENTDGYIYFSWGKKWLNSLATPEFVQIVALINLKYTMWHSGSYKQ